MNKFAFRIQTRRLLFHAIQLLWVIETLGLDVEPVQSKFFSMTSVCLSSALIVSLKFVLKTAMIHFSSCGHSLDFHFFGDSQQFSTDKYSEFELSLPFGHINVDMYKQFRVRQTTFCSLFIYFVTQYENKIYQTSNEVKREVILTPACFRMDCYSHIMMGKSSH